MNRDKLRELKLQYHLTCNEIAAMLHTKRNTVAVWLSGRRNMPDAMVELLQFKLKAKIEAVHEAVNTDTDQFEHGKYSE